MQKRNGILSSGETTREKLQLLSYIYPSSFAAEHCIFSAEKYSAVCLQDCYLCWGRPGSAEALAETWASAIKTPRSAEPTQNFFLEKPERYAFLIKKFKGTCSNLGNSRESSQNCPGFYSTKTIFPVITDCSSTHLSILIKTCIQI
jgi:hypothetical protein